MKLAFVYDRINKIGGAERILRALHQIWPQAPWYTAVYSSPNAPWAKGWHVHPSFLQKLPFSKNNHEFFFWLMPLAFESFNFDNFDVVISITSAEAKGIITKPQTLHLCYCLTPTRYLYTHTSDYLSALGLLKPVVACQLSCLRQWDQIASTRPDHYLAISQTVKKRIKKYYHRDSQVIYPPLDFKKFSIPNNFKPKTKNYFLIVSRLVAYKKIDLAIKACNQLNLPLVIVGTGRQQKKLKKIAGPTVRFTGQLADKELVSYYQNCQALIFTAEEDFGLVSLEAQAAGKPVIAFNRGGACETIIPDKTGEFFGNQTVGSLIKTLKNFSPKKYSRQICQENAGSFSLAQFKLKFKQTLEVLWQKHQQV